MISETGNGSDDAAEEALTDHHLDEVAEMIERTLADEPSSEGPLTDDCAGCHGS